MKTRLFLLVILCVLTTCQQAQQTPPLAADSVRVADATWQVDSLDGFCLKRCSFPNLFGAKQYLCILEIPEQSPRRLAFVYDSATAPVSVLASRVGALAAVNGSYFDMDSLNPICYLRIGGVPLGENTPQKSDTLNRKYYQYASLLLDSVGHPLLRVPDSNRHCEEGWTMPDIMTAGPMLLLDGAEVPQRNDRTFVTHRHNRTALALKPDGTVLLVVADGRFTKHSAGFSLPEWEHVLRWLGCTQAINLDGGGSTTMYVKDFQYNGVVNYPSENGVHDHFGERPVSNAVVVF